MVRDDPFGEGRRSLAVIPDELDDWLEEVRFEKIRFALQDVRDALEAHARVNCGSRERHERAVDHAALDRFRRRRRPRKVTALVVLREDQVPELGESIAVVGYAVVAAASHFFATVPPDLGVGSARPATEPPPVVAETRDAVSGDAGLHPDVQRLVVRRVDSHAKPIDGHLESAGHELPSERDRGLLEIGAGRREVAEHLEEGVVAVGLPHLVDVSGAQALLRTRQPGRGRIAQAQVVGLERLHSGRDEQGARVVLGHQRRTGEDLVLPACEML